jgi:hypothetical protein
VAVRIVRPLDRRDDRVAERLERGALALVQHQALSSDDDGVIFPDDDLRQPI